MKDRQYACSKRECQSARQADNNAQYLSHNPVDYKQWYQDYGKVWNEKNPDYQKQRRSKNTRSKQKRRKGLTNHSQICTLTITRDKKEQLTFEKTIDNKRASLTCSDKKEQLTDCYYVIKVMGIQAIESIPVSSGDKKE